MKLHHRVDGTEGPWVALAHSLASDMTLLDAQADLLARTHRVLRFDIRGHGRSEAPEGPYAMGDLADDVQSLFESLGINRTAYVGVSLGAMIGLTHALRHPGTITRLFVADTTSGYPAAAHGGWNDRIAAVRGKGTAAVVDGTLARWFTPAFRERETDLMRHFAGVISATPAAGFIGCCQAIVGYGIASDLRRIGCPTMVVVGEEDQATTPAMARALADGIPNARLEVIPAAAHQANIEQPDRFNRALEEFFSDAG